MFNRRSRDGASDTPSDDRTERQPKTVRCKTNVRFRPRTGWTVAASAAPPIPPATIEPNANPRPSGARQTCASDRELGGRSPPRRRLRYPQRRSNRTPTQDRQVARQTCASDRELGGRSPPRRRLRCPQRRSNRTPTQDRQVQDKRALQTANWVDGRRRDGASDTPSDDRTERQPKTVRWQDKRALQTANWVDGRRRDGASDTPSDDRTERQPKTVRWQDKRALQTANWVDGRRRDGASDTPSDDRTERQPKTVRCKTNVRFRPRTGWTVAASAAPVKH